MKSVITTICLLIPLVVIFIIIDRKDFYSGDDVAVQQKAVTKKRPRQKETLKLVEQPTDEITRSLETKPAEPNPAAEGKHAETKPAEPNPAEGKQAETKSMAESKPVEQVPGGESIVKKSLLPLPFPSLLWKRRRS